VLPSLQRKNLIQFPLKVKPFLVALVKPVAYPMSYIVNRTTTLRMPAGQAGFELLMLGYNIMNLFKEQVLNQSKTKSMVATIRDRLFLIPGKPACRSHGAGRLVHSARQWVLKLEATWAYRDEYEEALARLS